MYCEKMVLAVKVGGRVLREVAGEVYLPFGSEYSVMLKNMSGKRAVVHVEIDGKSATDGGVILDVGKSVDLERFIGGNLHGGRRFRFIEKTDAISENRGDRVDDGFIRVTYQFEKPLPVTVPVHYEHYHWYRPYYWNPTPYWFGPSVLYTQNIGSVVGSSGNCLRSASVSCSASVGEPKSASVNNAGITVEGSHSGQQFTTGNVGALEGEVHSMVLRLLGKDDGRPVAAPVTVKTKKKCSSCGKEWEYAIEYCGGCGTFLRQ